MNDSVRTSSQERHAALAEQLADRFSDNGCEVISRLGEVTLVIPAEHLVEVATELRDAENFLFKELIDLCGVDYSGFGQSEWVTTSASGTGFGRGVEAGPHAAHRDKSDSHAKNPSMMKSAAATVRLRTGTKNKWRNEIRQADSPQTTAIVIAPAINSAEAIWGQCPNCR